MTTCYRMAVPAQVGRGGNADLPFPSESENTHMKSMIRIAASSAVWLLATGTLHAQTPPTADGNWRGTLGAGATLTSGNTRSSAVSINGEAVRQTADDKLRFYGTSLYGKVNGDTTANLWRLGGRYDHDINPRLFAFGGLDFERDKIGNLKLRSSLGGGLGLHVIREPQTTFDIFGGLGYVTDKYYAPISVAGDLRSRYSRPELLLGEESTHKLSANTSFRQRLVVYPNLDDRGEYRSVFDAGLAVAMSSKLSLTVGLQNRYNTDPGIGVKKSDTLFITGIAMKID